MPVDPQAPQAPEAVDMTALLCRIAETYGRGICREPQRLAGMLRDLCPERRRESFLLVSALRERVVADVIGSLDAAPEDVLVVRGARKLSDNLGLAEDSARWAVSSWIPACRVLATAPDLPLRPASDGGDPDGQPAELLPAALPARRRPVDWGWLGWCAAGGLSAVVAVATVVRTALWHGWNSMAGWFAETALLAAGLGAAAAGLGLAARALRRRAAPNHRVLDPDRSAAAMLVEVATLLTLPLAPVLAVAVWVAEWTGELHMSAQPHDLSFHLGRILQSLLLGLFLWIWSREMIAVQGRIASSMVRRR